MSIDTVQSTQVPAGTWTIDPSHSEVGFTVRHLMTKVRGQFEKFEGSIVTTDDVTGFRANASIDLNSVNTRDENRDNHDICWCEPSAPGGRKGGGRGLSRRRGAGH